MVPPCVPHDVLSHMNPNMYITPRHDHLSLALCCFIQSPLLFNSRFQDIATNRSNFILLKLLECRYSAWHTHMYMHTHSSHTCTHAHNTYAHPCTVVHVTCQHDVKCVCCTTIHCPLVRLLAQNYSISCML